MLFDAKAHITAVNFLYKYFTGRENKPMDLLIAAHAKALKISIITNNAKDFIFKEVTVFHYPKFWYWLISFSLISVPKSSHK